MVTRKYALGFRSRDDRVGLDYLMDGITDDEDPIAADALAQEVFPAALRIRHQHRAAVVDDPAIDFLGHAVVVAAIAGFHVQDGDAETTGHDSRQAAVRIPEDQQSVWPMVQERGLHPGENLAGLGAEARRANAERHVRRAHGKLPVEHPAQPVVEVLTGVHEHVVHMLVEQLDDPAETDDLRTGSEDGHDLHRHTSRLVAERRRRNVIV
jgi:hypothetical protein